MVGDGVNKETLLVGGIEVDVFSALSSEKPEVVVLFLLHGRTGERGQTDQIAERVVRETLAVDRDLIVVSLVCPLQCFEHHGSLIVLDMKGPS